MVMRVIVNADDLGISREANAAILDSLHRGRLTSATILANGPEFDAAMRAARGLNNVSLGVHLNVTQFSPLSQDGRLKAILNPEGEFFGNRIRQVPIDAGLTRAIFAEWSMQIERILSCGIKISHIDSHHHVHTIPQLFFVLKRIQKKYGIRHVRLSMNVYPRSCSVSRLHLFKKKIWNNCLRYYYATKTTQGFTSLSAFLEICSQGNVNFDSCELMTHPGNDLFSAETSQLLNDELLNIRRDLNLINYMQI